MSKPHIDATIRLEKYLAQHGIRTQDHLGSGVHGSVFLTDVQTAVKVHEASTPYRVERDVYRRLADRRVSKIRECAVPVLLYSDDELLVIEMTAVKPPFVLDFAGAYLDRRPDFSDETMAEWRIEKEEQFGSDWAEVDLILAHLEGLGVYLSDISPRNIMLKATG